LHCTCHFIFNGGYKHKSIFVQDSGPRLRGRKAHEK
jgi:hypothetical protein